METYDHICPEEMWHWKKVFESMNKNLPILTNSKNIYLHAEITAVTVQLNK